MQEQRCRPVCCGPANYLDCRSKTLSPSSLSKQADILIDENPSIISVKTVPLKRHWDMALDESNLEKKFDSVSNSQDSIQSLSLWILHHKNHFKKIIQIWMRAFEKAKISHRLTLFYLANDVIQHAKKKNLSVYVDEFAQVLKEATHLVREEKIKASVSRVLNIWQERNIYPSEFIEELKEILLDGSKTIRSTNKIVAEFKLSVLVEKMKKLKKVETGSKSKIDAVNFTKLEALSCEMLNHLKDKSHGEQYSKDFEDATRHLDSVVHALEREILVRSELIEALEKSEIFYDTQKEEAKIVANAYRNFAVRVKGVKRKLTESKQTLPSPLPSPCADAPSPTNSDDGPVLPTVDTSLSHIKALMNAFNENSSGSHQVSSLDMRLSNLMQNIPAVNNEVNSKEFTSEHSIVQPTLGISHQIVQQPPVDPWAMQSNSSHVQQPYFHSSKYLQQPPPPPPPPPPPIPSGIQSLTGQDLFPHVASFEYDYTQSLPSVSDSYSNNGNDRIERNSLHTQPQPIQAVISSRSDSGSAPSDALPPPGTTGLRQYDEYNNANLQQPRENFEPADMDLGNSDDDDSAARLQNQQRVLKVIETRRMHMLPFVGHEKLGSPSNSDSMYSNNRSSLHNMETNDHHGSPGGSMKTASRLAVRSSGQSDERQRWRSARPPSSMSSHYVHDNSQSNQNRQWKTHPRNARRGSFSRRY